MTELQIEVSETSVCNGVEPQETNRPREGDVFDDRWRIHQHK